MPCNNLVSVITPIHKYKFINLTLDNFYRQAYQNKELILILNGELSNYKLDTEYKNIITLYYKDELNIAKIRNIGLNWMGENNRNIFSFMDSDDYYYSEYLTEAINLLQQGYELVGKSNFKFKNKEDIYYTSGILNERIQGPTITGYLTDKRFNVQYKLIAEDLEFISQHSNIGYSSIDNFIYNVREDSIQNRSFDMFIELMKMYNTLTSNISFELYKNDKLYWKFGDGFDTDKIFKSSSIDEINEIYTNHDVMIKSVFDSE